MVNMLHDLAILSTAHGDERFQPRQLVLPDHTPIEEWAGLYPRLESNADDVQWWRGDWVNFAKAHYGEDWTQFVPEERRSIKTYMNCAWVAARFPASERRPFPVRWYHHMLVAARPKDEREQWLDRAEAEGLTREEMAHLLGGAHPDELEDIDHGTVTIPRDPTKAAFAIIQKFPVPHARLIAQTILDNAREATLHARHTH